jgi:hypothetical protein
MSTGAGMADQTMPLRVVVDRSEGDKLVLVEEDGRTWEVLAEELPEECRAEGAVLQVPLDAKREPLWLRAHRDAQDEARRRREVGDALKRLRKRDPGGNVDL